MGEQLNTIWMNVTTSANWERPAVGIVRVEISLRDELSKLYGTRFRQCVWKDGQFVEWVAQSHSSKNVVANGHDTEHDQRSVKPALPMIFPILPRKQALIAMGQSLLSLIPGRLRPHFNRLLYRIRPLMGRLLLSKQRRRIFSILGQQLSLPSPDRKSITKKNRSAFDSDTLFSPGDVLISLGLDWDYSYYKQFYELRKTLGIKVVTCCYDLIPVLYPQYCVHDVSTRFKSYFLDVADGSDLILCISKQSEKDLKEMLDNTGGAMPPTHVFPLGDNVPLVTGGINSTSVQALCKEPFILYVSTIERRKNHEVLYRAYHLLCAKNKRAKLPKLVFVGMPGWGVSELIKDIEFDPMTMGLIVQLNHVSDNELSALYEAALFCVFPSLYEGWGLPVGEALSFGKVVISSDRGSLPEVGGDIVTYINPWDPEAWANEIYKIATDAELLRSLEANVRETYQPRKWTCAASSVKQAIESIQNSK